MMKRAQFNFVWLFAIIAGAAILALAIYGASKAGDTARFQTDTEIAKSISIITDPLQAGFAEGSFGKISFKQETRVNNLCFEAGSYGPGDLGRNKISVSTKSDVGESWGVTGEEISITNKYLFSSEKNTGKEYYVFSKSFEFPYKVADLVLITPEKYCFINPPKKIKEEVEGMNLVNIRVENCSEDSLNVCFGSISECDITVRGSCGSNCDTSYDYGSVERNGEIMKYGGNLMYAAIFSDKQIYDCNVQRLLYRNSKIAEELAEKTDLMNARNCNTNLKSDLIFWRSVTANATSEELADLSGVAKSLERKNKLEACGLW